MKKHYFFLLMLLGLLSSARAQAQTFTATGGNQTYAIPSDGTVTITATGGSSGNLTGLDGAINKGGSGSKVSATFDVKNGDNLIIVAGSNGTFGGGGGGSAVILQRTGFSNNFLLVAGAGGGSAVDGTTASQGSGGYGTNSANLFGGGSVKAGGGGGGFLGNGEGFTDTNGRSSSGKAGTPQGGGNGGTFGSDPTGFGFGGGGAYDGDGSSSRGGGGGGGGGGGYRGGDGGAVDNGGDGGTSFVSSNYGVNNVQTQAGVTGGGTDMSGSVVINFVALKPTLGTPSVTNVTCNGGTNGSISASATGGSGTLTFSLSPGNKPSNTSGSFMDLAAGAYMLTVTDANGKNDSKSDIQVTQPTAVTFTTTTANVKCFGGSDGSIRVMASGGDPSRYSYSDDGGQYYQPPATFNGRKAGTYAIKVKDSRNCESQTQSVTIAEPAPISFTTTAVMPKCFGGSDGSISVSASGGTGTLQYSKDGGTNYGSASSFTGLSAGTYSIRVKDANGCETAVQSVKVSEPTKLTVTISGNTSVQFGYVPNSNCTSLTANASGGTGAKTYQWIGGSTSTSPTINVCPTTTTTYTVRATDANGCTTAQSVTVTVNNLRCGYGGVKVCVGGREQCIATYLVPTYLRFGATLGGCNNIPARMGYEEVAVEAPLTLSLKAYPNPVTDAVTVEVLSRGAGGASFEVLDLTGRARQSRQQELTEGINVVQFKLGSLPTGIYLIRAVDALGHQAVVRVNKQ